MKITAISDTHGKHAELNLTGGDLLIHAGDISNRGLVHEVNDFLHWFSNQNYTHKIFIAGNHDFLFERNAPLAQSMIPDNIIYLNDSECDVDGVKFWGSPITPFFFNWAFNRLRGLEIRKYWDMIPDHIDVLITHGPPADILDKVTRGSNVGCQDLKNKVHIIQPQYHIFGHIHESSGIKIVANITFINASVVNEHYKKVNDGFDFVIDDKVKSK